MKFSLDWDNAVEKTSDIDLYAVGDLSIDIGGVNVCVNHEGHDRNRSDTLPISVYPLAEGIAMDWWQLFGGRDGWSRLKKNRGGYAVPDIRLRCDGDGFDVECHPYRYENPRLFFPQGGRERLGRADVERILGDFLTRVLARLDDLSAPDTGFRVRWNAIQASLQNPDETSFCEAAGALGHDPYDIPDDIAESIEASATLFSGEQLIEFVAGLRAPSTATGILDWIRKSEQRPRHKSLLPSIKDVRSQTDDAGSAPGRPWARGYRCAQTARRALGMTQNDCFRSLSKLAKRLGAPHFSTVPPVPGVTALVQSGDDGARIHLGRAGGKSQAALAGNLFAFARAFGDAVANPVAERSVVNDLHEASRQACGRAFAAEFLAPIDEIESMREDGLNLPETAARFGVALEVVERQLQNAERIRAACSPPLPAGSEQATSPLRAGPI